MFHFTFLRLWETKQLAVHSNFKHSSLLYFVRGFRKETGEEKRKRQEGTLLGTWNVGPVSQTQRPKMHMWSKVHMGPCA